MLEIDNRLTRIEERLEHRQPFPPQTALVSKSLKFLCYPHDLVHGAHALADLLPAVLAEITHSIAARGLREHGGIFAVHDQFADLVVQFHHLENAYARRVAAAVALPAPLATVGKNPFALG